MKRTRNREILSEHRATQAQTELERFWEDLDGESDRGMVLSVGAYFDTILEDCLAAYFQTSSEANELLSNSRELGTFSARNKMCFALRIISNGEYKSLKLLSAIRNDFAHQLLVSFDQLSISDKTFEFGASMPWEGSNVWVELKEKSRREIFSFTAFCLSDYLWLRPYDVALHVESYEDLIPDHVAIRSAAKT